MSQKSPIFVTDDSVIDLLKLDKKTIKPLIKYQIERTDKHKIYLPPSVRKICLEKNEGETKAQVENLFTSVISTVGHKTTIAQELCLTAEMLKIDTDEEIILVTKNPRFLKGKLVPAIKGSGFSTIIGFDTLGDFLNQDEIDT